MSTQLSSSSEALIPIERQHTTPVSGTRTPSSPLSDRHLAAAIGRNTLFGVACSTVQFGTRFVMVPLVIYHLGLAGYGIWSIVMATAGYMRFGSAGLKSAFQKYVAEATGNKDFETANKLLSTGSISMLVLSLAGLIPFAIYSEKLAKAAGVPTQFLVAASGSITLLAAIMVISNFGAVFEAIVMGGHRIDLTKKLNIITIGAEAVAIITMLHFGYGLLAMAVTISLSELVYIFCCFLAAKQVVPQIHISTKYFTRSVFHELIRFAGSYQLVNILELLYALLLPVTVLKYFGAEIAGVYAVVTRLVAAAMIGNDALILPLLSGGTVMFASGSADRTRRFFRKAFKVTAAVTLPPLAFVAAFGALVILVWTGQVGPNFRTVIWFICIVGLFGSISRLQLILYRASGNALHDNVRQAFRLGVLAALAVFGGRIGFTGILGGLALAELIGVVYMFFAMMSAIPCFRMGDLVPDTVRLTAATMIVITAGAFAYVTPILRSLTNERVTALIKLGVILLACLIASWPAVSLTKSMSTDEERTLLALLLPWRKAPVVYSE